MSAGDEDFTRSGAVIAAAIGIALLLPSFHLLKTAYGLVNAAENIALTNTAARQSFALLADGISASSNVEVPTTGAAVSTRLRHC